MGDLNSIYDSVIIGSGMGGLCSAARLAKKGMKVLVIEKLPYIGGRSSTTQIKGYAINTGAYGFQKGGVVEQTLKEIGKEMVPLLDSTPCMKYRIKGKQVVLPEKGGFRILLSLASNNEEEVNRVLTALKDAFINGVEDVSLTGEQWLGRYTSNIDIRGIFQAVAGNLLSVNLNEAPADGLIGIMSQKGSNMAGMVFALNGTKEVINCLASVVEECGGTVITKSRAIKINVEGNKGNSVIISHEGNNRTIHAKYIIADNSPMEMIGLIGKEHIDLAYQRRVEETIKPVPGFEIVFVSDIPLMDFYGVLCVTDAKRVTHVSALGQAFPKTNSPRKYIYVSMGPYGNWQNPDVEGDIKIALHDLDNILPGFDKMAEILVKRNFHGSWPVFGTLAGFEIGMETPFTNIFNVSDATIPKGYCGMEGCAERAKRLSARILDGTFK